MKKNLQNKTKMAIIIIATLLVSGQLVFGELKKSEIWNSDKIVGGSVYGSFFRLKRISEETEIPDDYYAYNIRCYLDYNMRDLVSNYIEFAPINFYGYTIYGGYTTSSFTLYNIGKDKKYKSKNSHKYNKISSKMAFIYIPNVGYKVFIRIYDNHIKPATEFEDMVIGFVNTNNNTYICNTKTVKVSETDYNYMFSDYYSNRYIGEAVLDIPDNSTATNNLGLYISNNYIQGKYIYGNVGSILEISKSSYIRFKKAETNLKTMIKEGLFTPCPYESYQDFQSSIKESLEEKRKKAKIKYGVNVYLPTYANSYYSTFDNIVAKIDNRYVVYTEGNKFYIIVNGEKVYGKSFTANPFFLSKLNGWHFMHPFVYWEFENYKRTWFEKSTFTF